MGLTSRPNGPFQFSLQRKCLKFFPRNLSVTTGRLTDLLIVHKARRVYELIQHIKIEGKKTFFDDSSILIHQKVVKLQGVWDVLTEYKSHKLGQKAYFYPRRNRTEKSQRAKLHTHTTSTKVNHGVKIPFVVDAKIFCSFFPLSLPSCAELLMDPSSSVFLSHGIRVDAFCVFCLKF